LKVIFVASVMLMLVCSDASDKRSRQCGPLSPGDDVYMSQWSLYHRGTCV